MPLPKSALAQIELKKKVASLVVMLKLEPKNGASKELLSALREAYLRGFGDCLDITERTINGARSVFNTAIEELDGEVKRLYVEVEQEKNT